MNYFFAITLPERAREQLASFAKRWEQQIDPAFNARWYPPEDYHLTIKFLGDISEPLVSEAKNIAEVTATWNKPAMITQKPLVRFSALVKPHVLWVELASTRELNLLAIGLEGVARALGVKPEHRPFKPHITVARCRPDTDVPPFILEERAFDEFTATEFVLMQTLPPEQRTKEGKARYNIVQTFPFGNAHS